MNRQKLKRMLYWFCRLSLGVIFLATGTGKALDLPGFIGVMKMYELGLPEGALWLSGLAVTLAELALGVWILAGWHLRWAALLAVVMNAGYFVWLTSALWRGLDLQNCGCYGVFLARPLRWYTPLEDLWLIAAAVVLYVLSGARRTQKASERDEAASALYQTERPTGTL